MKRWTNVCWSTKTSKAIRHTGIIVTDMEKSLEFYRDLLGLKVVLDAEWEGEYFAQLTGLAGVRMRVVMLAAMDGKQVELFQFHSHPKQAPGKVETSDIGCSHIALEVDALDKLYAEMQRRGIRCNCAPLVSPDGYAKVTYCHDPDGAIIELVEILDASMNPYQGQSQGSSQESTR